METNNSDKLLILGETVLSNDITFHVGHPEPKEILRLSQEGMFYKGELVRDAGEAWQAFMNTMEMMREINNGDK